MNTKLLQQYSNSIHRSEDINEIYRLTCECLVELTCAINCIPYNSDYFQVLGVDPAGPDHTLPDSFIEILNKSKNSERVLVVDKLGMKQDQSYAGLIIPNLRVVFIMALANPHSKLPKRDGELSVLLGSQVLIATEKNQRMKSAEHLDKLIEQATRLGGGSRGGLHKYDEASQRLVFIAGYNRYLSVSMNVNEGLAGYLVRSEKPYLIEDNYNNSPEQHPFYKGNRDFPCVLKVLLKFDGRIVGILSIDAELGHKFTPRDAEEIIRFGQDHIVPELVRPSLLDRLEQINRVIATIAADSASGNLRSTLKTIVRGCKEITGCSSSTLYVYRLATDDFYLEPVHDGLLFPQEEIKQAQIPARSIFHRSFDGQPYIIEDIRKDEYSFSSEFIQREKINSYAAIPLSFQKEDDLRGILFVNYLTLHRFTSDEINAIFSIANQATVAIQNERSRDQIREQLEVYQSLREINFDLTRNIDSKQFFSTLVQKAAKLLDAPRAGLREYEEVQKALYLIAHWNRFGSSSVIKVGQGIAGRLVKRGAPPYMIVDDYDKWISKHTPALKGIVHGAVVAVPLKWEEKPIGVLYINDDLGRKFTQKDVERLLLFADQAAAALAKYRMVEKVNNVGEIASAIGPLILADDLDATLNQIVKYAKVMVDECDIVTLYVIDPDSGLLKNPPYHTEIRFPEKIKLDGFITKTSKIYSLLKSDHYIVGPWDDDFLFNAKHFIVDEGIKSYAAVPLRTAQGNVGLLFAHYREQHHFRDYEIELLHQFAAQAAVAIQNSQAKEGILQRAKALDLLNKISNRITSKLAPDELFLEIVTGAVELTNAASGVIHLLGETNNDGQYTIAGTFEFPKGAKLAPTRLQQQTGVTWTVATTGRKHVFNEITSENSFVHPSLYQSGIRSMIVYPLNLEDKVLGVLFLNDTRPRSFKSVEAILEQFANHAAIAIYKAKQISVLGELERRQKEFVTIVVHELRTPLSHMQNSTHNLLHSLHLQPDLKEEIEAIDRNIQQMSFLVNNLYNARRLQENKINFRPEVSDLNEIITKAVKVVNSINPNRIHSPEIIPDLDFTVPTRVIVDSYLIEHVIVNLVHNAVKFTPRGSVKIKVTRAENKALVKVIDNGCGIPKEKLKDIQNLGFQVSNNPYEREYEGMGVGLYVVTEFLKLHDSQLEIRSTEKFGSIFSFTILLSV